MKSQFGQITIDEKNWAISLVCSYPSSFGHTYVVIEGASGDTAWIQVAHMVASQPSGVAPTMKQLSTGDAIGADGQPTVLQAKVLEATKPGDSSYQFKGDHNSKTWSISKEAGQKAQAKITKDKNDQSLHYLLTGRGDYIHQTVHSCSSWAYDVLEEAGITGVRGTLGFDIPRTAVWPGTQATWWSAYLAAAAGIVGIVAFKYWQ